MGFGKAVAEVAILGAAGGGIYYAYKKGLIPGIPPPYDSGGNGDGNGEGYVWTDAYDFTEAEAQELFAKYPTEEAYFLGAITSMEALPITMQLERHTSWTGKIYIEEVQNQYLNVVFYNFYSIPIGHKSKIYKKEMLQVTTEAGKVGLMGTGNNAGKIVTAQNTPEFMHTAPGETHIKKRIYPLYNPGKEKTITDTLNLYIDWPKTILFRVPVTILGTSGFNTGSGTSYKYIKT